MCIIADSNHQLDKGYNEWNTIRDEFTFSCQFLTNPEVDSLAEEDMKNNVIDQKKEMKDSFSNDTLLFQDYQKIDKDGNQIHMYKYH